MSTSPVRRHRMIIPAVAFVVLLLAIGGAVLFGLRQSLHPAHTSDHTSSYRKVARLSVDTDSADVTVQRGAGSAVRVENHREWTSEMPKVQAAVHAGTLNIGTEPCRGMDFGIAVCRIKIVVTVPSSLPVQLRVDSGDVTISDLSAAVDAEANSGSIMAVGLSGPLTLKSDSGDIDGDSLASKDVRFAADSGDVNLRFAAAPSTVTGTADSGNVRIEVPSVAAGYRVIAHADSGDVHVPPKGVHADSKRVIRATADSGDVTVGYGIS